MPYIPGIRVPSTACSGTTTRFTSIHLIDALLNLSVFVVEQKESEDRSLLPIEQVITRQWTTCGSLPALCAKQAA